MLQLRPPRMMCSQERGHHQGSFGEVWAEQEDLAALTDTQEQGFFTVMFPLISKGADPGWICSNEQLRAHPSHSEGSPN